MEKLDTIDGHSYIKDLEAYVRRHAPEIANSFERQPRRGSQVSISYPRDGLVSRARSSSTLAAALSFASLPFASSDSKQSTLVLTSHQLFYLLSRFEELSVDVGPMNVRLENINTEQSSAYVSFLSKPRRSHPDGRSSLRSVSSVHDLMSSMTNLLATVGLQSRSAEKARAEEQERLRYLYSSFTKIPSLKLVSDPDAKLIRGYEEFPFDTAVPLYAFHNLQSLEVADTDFRSFYGWDRLAERLTSLTLRRVNLDDLDDLLTGIVLDDFDRRRRRSAKVKTQASKQRTLPRRMHHRKSTSHRTFSAPGSPATSEAKLGQSFDPHNGPNVTRITPEAVTYDYQCKYFGSSPNRPPMIHKPSGVHTHRHRGNSYHKMKRSGSGSSHSSEYSRRGSISNLMVNVDGVLVPKWQRLSHLDLADNSLSDIRAASLMPVADSLRSFDLSNNAFIEIPGSLATLSKLRSLNLSHCMVDSLHSLSKDPLPCVKVLRLQGNRLKCIAGIERLTSLERLDLRDNDISDPMELARLTMLPNLREIWVSGNPFTKTHMDYRITIFNLFRRAPGFYQDIVIDNAEPRYSEKKWLVRRVGDRTGRPKTFDSSEFTAMLNAISNTDPLSLQLRPTVKRKPAKNDLLVQRRRESTSAIEGHGTDLYSPVDAGDRRDTEPFPLLMRDGPKQHFESVAENDDGSAKPTALPSPPQQPLSAPTPTPAFPSKQPQPHVTPIEHSPLSSPSPSPGPLETSNNVPSAPSTAITTPVEPPSSTPLIPSLNDFDWKIATNKERYNKPQHHHLPVLETNIPDEWMPDWTSHPHDLSMFPPGAPQVVVSGGGEPYTA